MNKQCPCSSQKEMADCCLPYIRTYSAPTAEALMRSRYTAFTLHEADYLFQTTSLAERRSGTGLFSVFFFTIVVVIMLFTLVNW